MKTFAILAAVVALAALAFVVRQTPRATDPVAVSPASESTRAPIAAAAAMDASPAPEAAIDPGAPVSSPPMDRTAELAVLRRELVRRLKSDDLAERERGLAELLPALIALDPAAAGELARAWPQGEVRDLLVRRVAQHWMAIDSAGAMEWTAGLEDIWARTVAAEAGVFQIAETDPAEAMRIAGLFDLHTSDGTMETLAQLWATKDLPAALGWARAQPPGDPRELSIARIALVQAVAEPASAASLAVTELSPGPVQTEAVISVLHQWALRDIGAASSWVERFPEGELRTRARQELLGAVQHAPAR